MSLLLKPGSILGAIIIRFIFQSLGNFNKYIGLHRVYGQLHIYLSRNQEPPGENYRKMDEEGEGKKPP